MYFGWYIFGNFGVWGMGAEEFGTIVTVKFVLWGLWHPKLRYVASVGKDFGGQRELLGTLGDHLGTLGDHLGTIWGAFGDPWGPFGDPWGSLGVPGGCLGGTWGVPGGYLGGTWEPWGDPGGSLGIPGEVFGGHLVQNAELCSNLKGGHGRQVDHFWCRMRNCSRI